MQEEKVREELSKLVEVTIRQNVASDIFVKIARLYFELEEYNTAKLFLIRALEIDSDDAEIYYLLGKTFVNLGDIETASMYFHEATLRNKYYAIDYDALEMKGRICF